MKAKKRKTIILIKKVLVAETIRKVVYKKIF
jgi:hypothetical protein